MPSLRLLALPSTALALSLFTGCSASFTMPEPSTGSLAGLHGTVFGGQQPVAGSHVYVYAVGTGGQRTSSTSLLTGSNGQTTADNLGNYYVTTDASGNFSVTDDYTCTSGQQIYLLATGGDSGAGANSAISLMAGLGQCPATGTMASLVPSVNINEVSTIAMAYAFAGLAQDPTHIASSSGTYAKLAAANAMGLVAQMTDIALGTARSTTANGNGLVPQAMIYTLADMLAACVNSTGASSPGCNTLNQAGGSDTATNAINLARYAFGNSTRDANLFGLVSATAPFQPTLTTQPSTYALRIDWFTGSQLTADGTTTYLSSALNRSLAIDQSGNAWVVGKYLHRISPTGALDTFRSIAFAAPGNLVVQPSSGLVWVADVQSRYSGTGTNKLYGFNGTGTNYGALGFGPYNSACATYECLTLAADASGYLWTADTPNSNLTAINVLGTANRTSMAVAPSVFCFDNGGSLWLSDGTSIQQYPATGGTPGTATYNANLSSATSGINVMTGIWETYTMNGANTPEFAFATSTGDLWYYTQNFLGGLSPVRFSTSLTPLYAMTESSSNEYLFASTLLDSPLQVIDGYAGKVYPVDTFASQTTVGAPAIDAGGNVWMVENNGNSVAEFVGLAGPVTVPYTPGSIAKAP